MLRKILVTFLNGLGFVLCWLPSLLGSLGTLWADLPPGKDIHEQG